MKKFITIFLLNVLCNTVPLFAQSNYDEYRNWAAMYAWYNNCEKAQKCYDIYKELSGNRLEKMEMIICCVCERPYTSSYNIDSYNVEFDFDKLINSIQHPDKDLIARVLNMYSDPEERMRQLLNMPNLSKWIDGIAWYESVTVTVKKEL